MMSCAGMSGIRAKGSSISVVIPTYNRQPETTQAIVSAIAQGQIVAEIIVVDDASEPAFILEREVAIDPRVKLLRIATNQGPAAARNLGIRSASFPWIAFLDSDDTWLPDKLEEQMKQAGSHTGSLVALSCAWVTRPMSKRPTKRIPFPASHLQDFVSGCWFCPGSTLLIPRESFERLGFYDERLRRLEDLEWFIRFGRAGGVLVVSEHAGSLIASGQRARLDVVRAAAALIRARYITGADRISPQQCNRLEAYLALECAAAARNERHWIWAAIYLLRSFALVPRRRLHLQMFWRRVQWEAAGSSSTSG